jgi:hypothetical protein
MTRPDPCDKGEVNSFDRQAIGNHSGAAEWFSDAAVGAAISVPVIADRHDVRWGTAFREDMEVLAEVSAVNGAPRGSTFTATSRPGSSWARPSARPSRTCTRATRRARG